MTGKSGAQGARLLAAEIGQRHVGPARVPAEQRPLRLAVADQPEVAGLVGAHAAGRPHVTPRPVSGRAASAASAAKNWRVFQPKIEASTTPGSWTIAVLYR